MGKHTKGPWRIKNVGEDAFTVQVWTDESHGSVLIATAGGMAKFENARLIAAAPELLEALQRILECESWNGLRARVIASEAIRKATEE